MFFTAARWPRPSKGLFFGITSIAVSLEYDEDADFYVAAGIAAGVIGKVMRQPESTGRLFNINIPTAATRGDSETKIVPMGLAQYGRSYEKRNDPSGRPYYWALWSEPASPPPEEADVTQLREGNVTLTPLDFDLTNRKLLSQMRDWQV